MASLIPVGTYSECPKCHTAPAYRRTLADPWDHHEVCVECAYCYTHQH